MAKHIDLPGMKGKGVAPARIKQLDNLAEAYVVERDKRLLQTPKEVAAKQKLIAAMHTHGDQLRQPDGSLVYRYDEIAITLTPGKEKLKVEAVGTGGEADE
jgi:hypothetical protein